jgi:hypothetical protein
MSTETFSTRELKDDCSCWPIMVKTMGVMDDAPALPDDPQQCQQLLLAAYQQAQQLQQQITASEQEVQSLNRVLDQTADSYAKLQQEHAAKLEELAWYQRWVHGKRRERVADGEGQQHLFELTSDDDSAVPNCSEPSQPVTSHSRRRRRELDLSGLPRHRHETDLTPEEKVCGWEQRRERHHFQRFQVHHLMVAFALVHTTSILGTKCFCGVWRTSTLLPTFDWSASIASGLGG